jgi:hypothetical protein
MSGVRREVVELPVCQAYGDYVKGPWQAERTCDGTSSLDELQCVVDNAVLRVGVPVGQCESVGATT